MSGIDEIFQGKWDLKRFVTDKNGIVLSTMKGGVLFSKCTDAVLYHEMIKNYYNGCVFSASKKYLYKLTSSRLNIHLFDYRLFASFERTKLLGVFSSFFCGDDCYQSMFTILNSVEIDQTVHVSGKTKRFSIQTKLLKNFSE